MGPVWVTVPLALACSLPLVARRRHPLAVLLVVLGAAVALVALAAPDQGPFEPFVAGVVAFYSLGANAPDRRGIVAFVAIMGLWIPAGAIAAIAGAQHGGNVFPSLVWVGAAWIVGRIIRGRHLRTLELERLTEELAHEREERARLAVAAERTRIARELHDVVSHNVSVMVIQAAAEERTIPPEQESTREVLASIGATGRDTLEELRRLLGVLRRRDERQALAPQPGLDDLDLLASQVSDAGLPVDVQREGAPRALSAGLELTAYRIVQEALTNSLKHARASRAAVTVRFAPRMLELEVVDDGRGGGGGGGAGQGVIGMRERVLLYGGELEVGSANGAGFRVQARLPLAHP